MNRVGIIALLWLAAVSSLAAHPDDVYWDNRFRENVYSHWGLSTLYEVDSTLYIAGRVVDLSGQPYVFQVAREVDTGWEVLGLPDFQVRDMVRFGSDLIVCGDFTSISGTPCLRVARFDGAHWYAMGSGFNNSALTLCEYQGELYCGGVFTQSGTTSTGSVARWNGTEWTAVGAGTGGYVYDLVVFNNQLVAAGTFSQHVLAWGGISWNPPAVSGSGFPNVACLAVFNSTLYAATSSSSAPYALLWRIESGTWQPAFGAMYQGYVDEIVVSGGRLLCGGSFVVPLGSDTARDLMEFDGTTAHAILPSARDLIIQDIVEINGQLTIAGSTATYREMNGAWAPVVLAEGGLSPDSLVIASVVYDNKLVIGGRFNYCGSRFVRHLAAWNDTSWSGIGGGVKGIVTALATYNGDLIVSGDFTATGDNTVNANNIVRWDGTQWHPMGDGLPNRASAMIEFQGKLYAASTQVFWCCWPTPWWGGPTSLYVWDGATWTLLGATTNGVINSLAVYDNALYAAGDFGNIGSTPVRRLARFDGIAWTEPGPPIEGNLFAFSVFENALYVGGEFGPIGSTCANRLARWDGASWTGIPTGFNEEVKALCAFGPELIIGGLFTSAGGGSAWQVARYNGHTIVNLGSGIGDNGPSVAIAYNGGAYFGGVFQVAGGKSSSYFARWSGPASTKLTYTPEESLAVALPMVCAYDCCDGNTGNVNCDDQQGVDIADLTALIDYLYVSFTPLCCPDAANMDGDVSVSVDIGDLTALIDNLFISFSPTLPCR